MFRGGGKKRKGNSDSVPNWTNELLTDTFSAIESCNPRFYYTFHIALQLYR